MSTQTPEALKEIIYNEEIEDLAPPLYYDKQLEKYLFERGFVDNNFKGDVADVPFIQPTAAEAAEIEKASEAIEAAEAAKASEEAKAAEAAKAAEEAKAAEAAKAAEEAKLAAAEEAKAAEEAEAAKAAKSAAIEASIAAEDNVWGRRADPTKQEIDQSDEQFLKTLQNSGLCPPNTSASGVRGLLVLSVAEGSWLTEK